MKEPKNIYVFKCREFYKIGIANHVHGRSVEIGTQIPFEIEVVANYKPKLVGFAKYDKTKAIRKIEKFLHHTFMSKRVKGEWFLLNDDDLKSIPNLIEVGLSKSRDLIEVLVDVKR